MVYDLGVRLKELRKKHNLSQEQVSRKTGVTRAAISAYERSTKTPSLDVLIRLTLIYHSSLDYILGLKREKPLFLSKDLTPEQCFFIEDLVQRLKKEFLRKNKHENV